MNRYIEVTDGVEVRPNPRAVGAGWPVDVLADEMVSAVRLALLLGEVERVTRHPDGRRETDTTHTVGLIYCLMSLARRLDECGMPIDERRLLRMAAVHDLPECYAGDVNTAIPLTPAERAAKDAREADSIERIRAEAPHIAAVIDEYERQDTIEARIVHYVDKMMPKITHRLDGGRAVLGSLGLTVEQVKRSHATQGAQLAARHDIPMLDRLFRHLAQQAEVVIADASIPSRQRFMVHTNSGRATFVKGRDFFVSQGGDSEEWGQAWAHVEAADIDAARAVGCVLQGGNPQQVGLSGVALPRGVTSRVDEDGHEVWRAQTEGGEQ